MYRVLIITSTTLKKSLHTLKIKIIDQKRDIKIIDPHAQYLNQSAQLFLLGQRQLLNLYRLLVLV